MLSTLLNNNRCWQTLDEADPQKARVGAGPTTEPGYAERLAEHELCQQTLDEARPQKARVGERPIMIFHSALGMLSTKSRSYAVLIHCNEHVCRHAKGYSG